MSRVGVGILFFLAFSRPCFLHSAVTRVFPGKDAITWAIKRAAPGDVLQIQQGIYKEHDIVVDKPITITGVSYPVIDGENLYQLFLVRSGGVTIQGLRIQNTGHSSLIDMAGVRIIRATRVVVRNNLFYSDNFAIYLQQCSGDTVEGNYINGQAKEELGSGNGIHAWQSDHLTIRKNTVTAHRDAIYFEFVTDSHISGNKSLGNVRYGLHFMFSHNDVYSDNTFSSNGAGVAVMYSRGVEMYRNTFSENWGDASYGLLLKEITDTKIADNTFCRNTVAIYMEGATRVHTARNLFLDNGWAMRIQASCSQSKFERNSFIGNTFDVTTNGTLMLNNFDGNFWDKYDGYDIDKNGIGDVPYYPVSLFSVVAEKVPSVMILFHSLLSKVMDQAEKVMPSVIPDELRDNAPNMKMNRWK